MKKLFIAGYRQLADGSICVIVKDNVSKNPLIRTKCEKNGSFWLVKGTTMEEAKEAFPIGSDASATVAWGEPRLTNSAGEPLTNVFEVTTL